MAKFEDQLFEDLMRNHGAALEVVPERVAAGRRRVGRALGVGGAALGVAGAVALTGTLFTGGAPAAYAVTKGDDGVVTVSITDIGGVTGANEELRRLGVRAVAVPVRDGCVEMSRLPVDTAARGTGVTPTVGEAGGLAAGSMTFDGDDIPEGDTLLLAAVQSPTSVSLGAALIKGDAPECVSIPTRVVHESLDPQEEEVRVGTPVESAVREGGR
jgi:hypothetical protein